VAIQRLNQSPAGLDFGIVAPNTTHQLNIVFSNQSSPSIDIDVTIAGATSPFTLGAGDNSFTLVGNGSSRTVEVIYAPTTVQVDDVTWTVTHNAPSPASPYNLVITAEAGTPMTAYALPDIENNPAGVMKIDLLLESDVSAPTIPTGVKVLSIGTLTELIDVQPGIVDVQNLEVELAEDYSTYTEGFWYHIIQTDPTKDVQLRFILDEDGTETFYFWGRVYREEIEWPELYINTAETDIIRSVKVRLVSLIHSLRDVGIETTIAEIQTHESANADYWTIESILAAILASGMVQEYSTSNIHIRATDLRLFKADLETMVAIKDAIVRGNNSDFTTNRGYFDAPATDTNRLHWYYQFGNAFDFLRALCLNFGWVCRYFYGQSDGLYAGDATDKHRFEFLTRGNAYADYITPENGIKESTLFSDTVNKSVNIRVSDVLTANEEVNTDEFDLTIGYAWYSGGKENSCTPIPINALIPVPPSVTEPNPHIEFDLDFSAQFSLQHFNPPPFGLEGSTYIYRRLAYTIGAGVPLPCILVGFYDYAAGAWNDQQVCLQNALMLYYARRFTSGRKMYERKYGSLKWSDGSTTSHIHLKPMKRIEINDQITTDNYYATEVRKDFESNTSTVLWIEE